MRETYCVCKSSKYAATRKSPSPKDGYDLHRAIRPFNMQEQGYTTTDSAHSNALHCVLAHATRYVCACLPRSHDRVAFSLQSDRSLFTRWLACYWRRHSCCAMLPPTVHGCSAHTDAVVLLLNMHCPVLLPLVSTKHPVMFMTALSPLYLKVNASHAWLQYSDGTSVIPCFSHVVVAGTSMKLSGRGAGGVGV